MATVVLQEGETVGVAVVKRLTRAAAAFNETLGNPTDI